MQEQQRDRCSCIYQLFNRNLFKDRHTELMIKNFILQRQNIGSQNVFTVF